MKTMTEARYQDLMGNDSINLVQAENLFGWHFCNEFDGLLVGPEMEGEWAICECWESSDKQKIEQRLKTVDTANVFETNES